MKALLNLIRWQNLVIVALTMILVRYVVIGTLISKISVNLINGSGAEVPLTLQFPWYNFMILIIATLCITAGGYVINDYFDIKTDLINRGEVIVGTKIPRRQAMMWHNILNIIGVAAGFYISWQVRFLWMGIIFLIVSGLLYFYSASYKRQFLVGNVIVSLLTAFVPMLVAFYEWPDLYRYYNAAAVQPPELSLIFYWTAGFAIFAFLTNLAREIIKDLEDFEGDITYGMNTLPVVLGTLTARIISIILVVVIILLLYIIWYFFLNDHITLIYISAAVVLPLVIIIYQLVRSANKKNLHNASSIMKFVMVTGILYSVVAKFIIDRNLF